MPLRKNSKLIVNEAKAEAAAPPAADALKREPDARNHLHAEPPVPPMMRVKAESNGDDEPPQWAQSLLSLNDRSDSQRRQPVRRHPSANSEGQRAAAVEVAAQGLPVAF